MKNIFSGIIFCSIILFSTQVLASELMVLIQDGSNNSKRWKNEVWKEYVQLNKKGKLPLKIVTFEGNNFPKWFAQALEENRIGKILGTPTFLIWDEVNKKEIGRFEGYTQKTNFYTQLDEAIMMVNQGQHPGYREGSGRHKNEGSGAQSQEGFKNEGSGSSHRKEGSKEMSKNIMDHMYKTPEEAKHFSEKLGFGGEIHSHETPQGTMYMPGPTM